MYFFTNSLLSPRTHSNGVGWSYTCLEVIKEVIKMSIIFPILVLQSIYNNNVEIANYSHNSESWFYEPVHMFDVFLPLFLCVIILSASACANSAVPCVFAALTACLMSFHTYSIGFKSLKIVITWIFLLPLPMITSSYQLYGGNLENT